MTDPRRFGLGVSAGELPGDLRPIRPREPRPERDPLHPPRPPAGVEFRRPLGATAAISLNLQAVHGRSLRSMPPSTPPDGSAAAEAVPIIPSDLPGTSPRAGTVTAYRRPRGPSLEEVTLGAEGPLGAPTYRGIEDVQEPNHQEAGHPGTFPNRPERNAAGPTSSPNRTAEGRAQEPNRQEAGHPGTFPNRQERNATGLGGTRNRAAEGREAWRLGVLQPEERGPASLRRADRYPCLLPLASAGPARRHRPGRLARSRAATRGLGLRGLAARVFGPRESRRQSRLPASVGTLSVRVSSFTTVMSRTVPSAWRTAWTRSTTWRIWERSPSTFVPEAWVSIIRPDSLSSSCERWTSRRTETPAPIGIAWISAVAFMGLEVKGLTGYRAA